MRDCLRDSSAASETRRKVGSSIIETVYRALATGLRGQEEQVF
jgi:hypothetical protein